MWCSLLKRIRAFGAARGVGRVINPGYPMTERPEPSAILKARQICIRVHDSFQDPARNLLAIGSYSVEIPPACPVAVFRAWRCARRRPDIPNGKGHQEQSRVAEDALKMHSLSSLTGLTLACSATGFVGVPRITQLSGARSIHTTLPDPNGRGRAFLSVHGRKCAQGAWVTRSCDGSGLVPALCMTAETGEQGKQPEALPRLKRVRRRRKDAGFSTTVEGGEDVSSAAVPSSSDASPDGDDGSASTTFTEGNMSAETVSVPVEETSFTTEIGEALSSSIQAGTKGTKVREHWGWCPQPSTLLARCPLLIHAGLPHVPTSKYSFASRRCQVLERSPRAWAAFSSCCASSLLFIDRLHAHNPFVCVLLCSSDGRRRLQESSPRY